METRPVLYTTIFQLFLVPLVGAKWNFQYYWLHCWTLSNCHTPMFCSIWINSRTLIIHTNKPIYVAYNKSSSWIPQVDWSKVERTCFSEWAHPEDGELGVQIVKDLHRTGCSLFCGEGGQENQALLKKVLLAYARWNKAVGETYHSIIIS